MIPIIKWGEAIQNEVSGGWSCEIEYGLAGKVRFPVFIDCMYQQGRYDEHGVVRHGYAADAPFIDTPRDARDHYSKRFGIESSYQLAKQSLALTSSRDVGLRLLMFVVSVLLQNSWRYLHWRYVAALRREIDTSAAFLHRLIERHDVSDTEFLVDGGGYLTALFRHELSGHLNYRERNHIDKWSQTVSVQIDPFIRFGGAIKRAHADGCEASDITTTAIDQTKH